ncbi:hypothetical protein MMC07_005072 [Pseudocyphellaria aurata]|nr:hypothetical protein [Pseudocyphellaria aurata]
MPLLDFIKERCRCGKPASFTPTLIDDGHHKFVVWECHSCRKWRLDTEKYRSWVNGLNDRPRSWQKNSVDRPGNIERPEESAPECSLHRTNRTNRLSRTENPLPHPSRVVSAPTSRQVRVPEAKPKLSRDKALEAEPEQSPDRRRSISVVEAQIRKAPPPNSSRVRPRLRGVTESVVEAKQRCARDQLEEEDALAELKQYRAQLAQAEREAQVTQVELRQYKARLAKTEHKAQIAQAERKRARELLGAKQDRARDQLEEDALAELRQYKANLAQAERKRAQELLEAKQNREKTVWEKMRAEQTRVTLKDTGERGRIVSQMTIEEEIQPVKVHRVSVRRAPTHHLAREQRVQFEMP